MKTPCPGEFLRRTRMRLGLTTRRVAQLSQIVAAEQNNAEFTISHARLVQVENNESVPSIFKLFALSAVYGVPFTELAAAYMDLKDGVRLHFSMQHPHTHLARIDDMEGGRRSHAAQPHSLEAGMVPIDVISGGGLRAHDAPVALLDRMTERKVKYAFIGTSDRTMYPLIRPGSFVQIEDCNRALRPAEYRTEFDRPIYLIETRAGYICSWCEVADGRLTSIPHPLSPCRTRNFAYPAEAEIVGRVTGIALRLTPAAAELPSLKPVPLSGTSAAVAGTGT